MNPENVEAQAEKVIITQAREEIEQQARVAIFEQAVDLEKSTMDQIVTLFDDLGVELEASGELRSHTFTWGDDPANQIKTHVTIFFKKRPAPQVVKVDRRWLGPKEYTYIVPTATDEIKDITVISHCGDQRVEAHQFRPYYRHLGSDEETSYHQHFTLQPGVNVPRYNATHPDEVWAHVTNVKETIDHIVAASSHDDK